MKTKSQTTALILSILFGWCGVDRFYLGYVGLGFLKLITAGGFGIWWVIDIILIACGSLTENQPTAVVAVATQQPAINIVNVASNGDANLNGTTTSSSTFVADELKKYKELLDSGAITQEEFDKKKAQLLGM